MDGRIIGFIHGITWSSIQLVTGFQLSLHPTNPVLARAGARVREGPFAGTKKPRRGEPYRGERMAQNRA